MSSALLFVVVASTLAAQAGAPSEPPPDPAPDDAVDDVRPPPTEVPGPSSAPDVIAHDLDRGLVAAVVDDGAGGRAVEIHDVAAGRRLATSPLPDEPAALAELLSRWELARRDVVVVQAQDGALRVPYEGGVLPLAVASRVPLARELATDPALQRWRARRVEEDRPYGSEELRVAHLVASGRILYTRRAEVLPGDEAALSFPAAVVDEGRLVLLEHLALRRGERQGDVWSFSPVLDLDVLLSRLPTLPREEGAVVVAPPPPAMADEPQAPVPAPDPEEESRREDPAATICCGIPLLGGLCAGLACFEICSDSSKAGRPSWNRCEGFLSSGRCR